MSNTTKITCRLGATAPGLEFIARVDDHVFFQGDPSGQHDLELELADDDAEHLLVFELRGKTADHTKVDKDGNITEDLLVTVTDLAFDDIKLGHVFTELAVYEHDYNGTQDVVQDVFHGSMGCNGTVTLPFTTPIYLWLLENM